MSDNKRDIKKIIGKALRGFMIENEIQAYQKDRKKTVDTSMLNDVESDPGFAMAGDNEYYEPDESMYPDGIDSPEKSYGSKYGPSTGPIFSKERVGTLGPRGLGPKRGAGFGYPTN